MKTLRFLLIGLLAFATVGRAQDYSQPGWYSAAGNNTLTPITISSSLARVRSRGLSNNAQTPQVYPAIAEVGTAEIQALARGLQNDPVKIFDYVHDHIRHVFYFGSKKGAELTLLEKSGNDFDQCALLVALLRAAGYSPTYGFGLTQMPYDATDGTHNDLHHWLQLTLVNTNWANTVNYLSYLTGTRGYPLLANYGDGNTVGIQRVWVELTVGSNSYMLDPAFKVSELSTNIFNVPSAMSFTSNGLMSAVGGSVSGNYVTNLNEAGLRSTLIGYTTNLLNYLQSNAPNASVQQILGGWQIVPATNTALRAGLLFVVDTFNATPLYWSNEPTNLMARFQITFARTNYQWYIPQFAGQRLSLNYTTNGVAQLWQDDAVLVTNLTTASDTNVILSVNQPFGRWNTTNNSLVDTGLDDYSVTNTYKRTNAIYVLTYAFEPDWGWLSARQQQLNQYLQEGLPSTSRQVVSETLNVMQLSWILQGENVERILANQLGVLPQYQNNFGRMAQENGNGYYIDIYMALSGSVTANGADSTSISKQYQSFDLASYFRSGLEHGIIEQMQGSNHVAASTVKMLELGSTNGKAIYLANSANWSTVSGQLSGYSTASKNLINSKYITQGYTVLLPKSGSNNINGSGSWAGYGLIARYQNSTNELIGMVISGGYNGGFADFENEVADINATAQTVNSQPDSFTQASAFTANPTGADPVDMANGTFQVEHTDLSLGQAEPRGITLSRYYNGTRRYSNPSGLSGGWLHNYSMSAATVSAPQAGLGETTPQQMAPMIAALYAAANTYNGTPDAKNWTVTALVAKWGIDQLYKNSASVTLGKDNVQFIKQPNGVFTAPANCTMTLIQSNSVYTLSQRHGNLFKFDLLGRLTNIVDQYNNPLIVTYLNSTSSLPAQVTDWKGRSLTFNYIGGQLTSVADNTGRSVAYSYAANFNAQGDLTAFTDAENKTSTYQYDTNHQITATLDAQSRLVVSNIYDGQGRVALQLTQGDTNKTWNIFWSGWQTVEQDPVGSQRIFSYDDLTRITSLRDALGNLTRMIYDGQSHVVTTISPLNETNRFVFDGNHNLVQSIDALNFTNQLIYDGQNNLLYTVDPLGHTNSFGYNARFSLTGQTNAAGDFVSYAFNSDGTLHTRADAGGATTYGYDTTYSQLNLITFPSSLGSESFANNALGDVTNHTNTRGFTTSFQYNSRRELTNSIAPTNVITRITFDSVGNVASTTDARNNVTSNTWSATRHLLTTILPSTPQGASIITKAYDNRDWLASTVDPLQNAMLYTNDAAQRLVSQTDPLLRTTKFIYDADSHQLANINAANETNSQTWDARGSLIKLTDGAGHFSMRAYDGAGNQIILTNRNGKKWQFQFDAANRLTNTITPLGRSTSLALNHQGLVASLKDPASQATIFNYDAKGRLTNRSDNVGTTLYHYDANDNVTNLAEAGLTNAWTYDAYNRASSYQDVYGNLIQYRYDNAGNLTNLIYPGNRNVFYAYDNLNRMTNVTDWANRKTSLVYDLAGRITSLTRPNGTQRIIGYDAAGQVTNILEQTAIGFPIALFKHNWNASATMQWEFATPLPHTNTPPTRTMTYDDDNQLYSVNLTNVINDLDGNLTSGPLTNDTFATYVYDARNRLLNAGGVTNVYDVANNRIGQTSGTNTAVFVVNPVAKLPQMLMRIKNGVTNYYIYGAGLLYQITETATVTNTRSYHYDYRGSTVALTDDNGGVTDRMEYSLYATLTYRVGNTDTPFLFNGRYGIQTDANGLLYMRARYYNPFLCRFLNPDPSGFNGGMNFFAYADGNPINIADPMGLQPSLVNIAIGMGPGPGESLSDWNNRFQGANQIALGIQLSVGAGAVVGAGGATIASFGATGLVAVGVPQSFVTGGLLVAGGTGIVTTGYSIYNNPSINNIAFNVGSLGGSYIVGGMSANYVASALSPSGYQPSTAASLSSDLSMAWRGGNGSINPLAFLSDWLLPGASVGPMSTGPSILGAAGTITGIGSGASSAFGLYSGQSLLDWIGNPVSSSSTGKPH